MSGWMAGWVAGRLNEWMKTWRDENIDGYIWTGILHVMINGWMDG